MRIYTITLNPAYDVHATTANFEAGCEMLATVTSREAGGKGVNISRALQANGIPNTAIVVVGTDNAAEFKQQLQAHGLVTNYLERTSRIRENLTIHAAGQRETRISFAGFPLDDSILQEVLAVLSVDGDTVITFTGRVATGMSMEKVKGFLRELQKRGAKLVLDSKSFTAADVLEMRPWLIKPNEEELAAYAGSPVKTMADVLEKARIFTEGHIENVLVSMGAQGAALLTKGETYIAKPPKVTAISTVGAGDSMIAGFLAAVSMGESAALCLKRAVAYGTAACLTEGTLPPRPEAVETIYRRTEEIL